MSDYVGSNPTHRAKQASPQAIDCGHFKGNTMQLMQPFNARDYDPTQGGTGGFPLGKHKVNIFKSEVKPTKDGNSGLALFEAEVIEGEFKGTVGAFRLNLYSNSAQAVEIAHKQFSALCHSVGVLQVKDTEQLHRIPFMIEVGLQKEPNEKKYTEVKKFFDANGNEPGQNGGGQQQQPQNNSGFGNNNQNQNNGQQQNNGGFGQSNNVPFNNGQDQNQNNNQNQNQNNGNGGGSFGQQNNGGQQQNNGNNGGNNQNWQPNNGANNNQGGSGGNGAGNGGNGGGWGQQRN